MEPLFEILFLEEAFNFLRELDRKHYEKIIYNMRRAQVELNPELFKKLAGEIWEFRTLYQGAHYRLLAFWDKTAQTDTLVVATHGFVKKKSKVPAVEIERAMKLRANYYKDKEIRR
jgi:phage-related protein